MRLHTQRALFFLLVFCASAACSPVWGQGFLQLHEPGANNVTATERSGIIIGPPTRPPIPPRPRPQVHPAILQSLEVRVDIDDQVAVTSLDQSFCNPNNRRLEGTYLFPLPPNAAVNNLSLFIDGKAVKCEVIEAKKARKIYEDIVRSMRDPALLEYIGRDLVKFRIFPIEANEIRRVKFQYSQVLTRDFGQVEYAYPLVARNQTIYPIGSFSLSGSIRSDVPITTTYSPTHNLDFAKKNDKQVKFSFEEDNHLPSKDLKIFYGLSKEDLGAGLVTFRKAGEKGYFMLLLAPRQEIKDEKKIPKDVTFVFDISGSMAKDDKIAQAKEALKYCLRTLRERDRFRIIRFSTETESFSKKLQEASKTNVEKAIKFVDGFSAAGGTAIDLALGEALDAPKSKNRPHIVVFLTDGKPTIGDRNVERIAQNAAKHNKGKARVFSFGVGFDVNTLLLDKVAGDNGGVSDYVLPKEDIEVKVSGFFQKVSDPVLTDVSVDFGGIKATEFHPGEIPDLFAGSQVAVVGRYASSGRKTILLKGRVGDEKKVYEYDLKFPKESESADFLPRLWAIRRVGHLVAEIRENGEEKELRDEVVRLGKKYAIATPYTSLLVQEDGETRQTRTFGRDGLSLSQAAGGRITNLSALGMPGRRMDVFSRGSGREKGRESLERSDPQSAPSMGPQAIRLGSVADRAKEDNRALAEGQSFSEQSYRYSERERIAGKAKPTMSAKPTAKSISSFSISSSSGASPRGSSESLYKRAPSGEQAVLYSLRTKEMKEQLIEEADEDITRFLVKHVAGETFYFKKGVWTQSEYDGKAKTQDVAFGSDAYFNLLSKGGDMGKFLALGNQVIFRFEGKWYRITSVKKPSESQ